MMRFPPLPKGGQGGFIPLNDISAEAFHPVVCLLILVSYRQNLEQNDQDFGDKRLIPFIGVRVFSRYYRGR